MTMETLWKPPNLGDLQFATSKDKKLGPKIPSQMRICRSQSFAAVETLEIKLETQVYNHAENTYVYICIYTPSGYLT